MILKQHDHLTLNCCQLQCKTIKKELEQQNNAICYYRKFESEGFLSFDACAVVSARNSFATFSPVI